MATSYKHLHVKVPLEIYQEWVITNQIEPRTMGQSIVRMMKAMSNINEPTGEVQEYRDELEKLKDEKIEYLEEVNKKIIGVQNKIEYLESKQQKDRIEEQGKADKMYEMLDQYNPARDI